MEKMMLGQDRLRHELPDLKRLSPNYFKKIIFVFEKVFA
jgi:hypothetical protein